MLLRFVLHNATLGPQHLPLKGVVPFWSQSLYPAVSCTLRVLSHSVVKLQRKAARRCSLLTCTAPQCQGQRCVLTAHIQAWLRLIQESRRLSCFPQNIFFPPGQWGSTIAKVRRVVRAGTEKQSSALAWDILKGFGRGVVWIWAFGLAHCREGSHLGAWVSALEFRSGFPHTRMWHVGKVTLSPWDLIHRLSEESP